MLKILTLIFSSFFLFISFAYTQNSVVLKPFADRNNPKSAPFRNVVDNGINGIKVSYSFIELNTFIKTHNKSDYSSYSITDFSHLQEAGKPALPSHIDLVAIPDGADYKLNIYNKNPQKRKTTKIFPALKPARDTQGAAEPEFEINKAFYNTDQIYPLQSVRIIGEMKYRGIRMAMVETCPVQYNPFTSELFVYSEISYEIVFSGASKFTNYANHSETFINQITNYPLNNKSFARESKSYYLSNKAIDNTDSKNYIIITHSDFDDAADSIANWKRQLGYSVEIISSNNWTTTAVKNAVHTRYQNWTPKPDYLLIIGDNGDVPSETFYTSDGDAFGSDLYYVCMDGSSDFIPDMAKGRISPSNAENAMMQVRKIINYERNPISDTAFYNNGANCAQYQDDDANSYADRRFLHTSEDIRDYIQSKGYNSERIYYTDNNVTPAYYNNGYYSQAQALPNVLLKTSGFDWTKGAADIATSINAGKFFVFHRDHGYAGGSGWAHPHFTNSNMSLLNNGDKLPIVFSINCHTGEFTLPSCFAESFMRHTAGSVGIFAASYYSYSGYNDGFSIGLIDGIWSNPGMIPSFGSGGVSNPIVTPHNDILEMGNLLNHGLTRVIQTWGGGNDENKYTHELFHYFGDPAMRMWTHMPDTIIASTSDTIACSATSFTIDTCNVVDAIATISKDGLLIGKITLTNGSGIIPISILQGAYFTLTISAPNYKPFQKRIYLGAGNSMGLYKETSNSICYGDDNSEIELFPVCGTPPYSILWSNGATTSKISNLANGTYSAIITDGLSNTLYDTTVVNGPSSVIQISGTIIDAKCYFESSGNITLNVSGSTPPYIYNWSTGDVSMNLSNKPAGKYFINVTDSFGCIYTDSFTIDQPEPLNVSLNYKNDSTGNCTGFATAVSTGGNIPYTYLWNDAANQITATAVNLCDGLYKVKVTDVHDCFLYKSVYILNTVGIESAANDKLINVSPNPSNTGIYNLEVINDNYEDYILVLYNAIGEQVLNINMEAVKGNSRTIDISKYAYGVYFLKIRSNNISRTYKLIYQK